MKLKKIDELKNLKLKLKIKQNQNGKLERRRYIFHSGT